LIIDDHLFVAEAIASAIGKEHQPVGIALRGTDALTLLRTQAADCVLLDLYLPDIDGFDLLRQIKDEHPAIKVVAMSGYNPQEFRMRAQAAGAEGFVAKGTSLTILRAALAAVAQGQRWFADDDASEQPAAVAGLTDRKLEILRALACAYHAHEVATYLQLATATVEEYIEQLKQRFRARTSVELVHAAMRAGLIGPLRPPLPPPPRGASGC
jgi:DNA-binding NarL/FixJ family response regulator